jgi:hypothetical protein
MQAGPTALSACLLGFEPDTKWIFDLPLTVLNKTKQDRQYVPFISLLIIGHGWNEKFKLSSSLSCDKID